MKNPVPSSAKGDGFASAGTEGWGHYQRVAITGRESASIHAPIVPRMLPEGYGEILRKKKTVIIKFFFCYFFS
jgi:hypothetical protein